MALVLTGLPSYSIPVSTSVSATGRVMIRRGQSVDGLNLSEEQMDRLRALEVRGQGRRSIPAFMEIADGFDGTAHTNKGSIQSPAEEKRQAAKAEEAAEAAAAEKAAEAAAKEAAAKAEAETKAEAKAKAEAAKAEEKPAEKAAPKKAASKKRAPRKKAAKKADEGKTTDDGKKSE